jgi:hypothetical protein
MSRGQARRIGRAILGLVALQTSPPEHDDPFLVERPAGDARAALGVARHRELAEGHLARPQEAVGVLAEEGDHGLMIS